MIDSCPDAYDFTVPADCSHRDRGCTDIYREGEIPNRSFTRPFCGIHGYVHLLIGQLILYLQITAGLAHHAGKPHSGTYLLFGENVPVSFGNSSLSAQDPDPALSAASRSSAQKRKACLDKLPFDICSF